MIIHRIDILMLHIPDGFLAVPLSFLGWILAIVAITLALRQTRDQFDERQIPLLGVMAAFIFAAQAINFPVAGGTSGHLLGGALAAIILGPWAAVLVMTAVIALQALLFQDGGLLVMGWNIVNMGLLTVFTAAIVYGLARTWLRENRTGLMIGAAVAAWLSVQTAAVATALELAASGTAPFSLTLPVMVGVHALIGVGEALITVGALLVIFNARPDLIQKNQPGSENTSRWVAAGLVVALLVALFSFAASDAPDGLERVAQDQGFLDQALQPAFNILPDYTIPFLQNPAISGIVAVFAGTFFIFCLFYLAGRLRNRSSLKKLRQSEP